MFAGKARAYGAQLLVRPLALPAKKQTILERLTRYKQFGLLQAFVNYGRKSVIRLPFLSTSKLFKLKMMIQHGRK